MSRLAVLRLCIAALGPAAVAAAARTPQHVRVVLSRTQGTGEAGRWPRPAPAGLRRPTAPHPDPAHEGPGGEFGPPDSGGVLIELRELVHGILPSVLTREGLRAGVDELAARMSIPVELRRRDSDARAGNDVGRHRFCIVAAAGTRRPLLLRLAGRPRAAAPVGDAVSAEVTPGRTGGCRPSAVQNSV